MAEKPDNVPSLEELGDGEELPEWWRKDTTITVTRFTKQRLNTHRDGRPWDVYLEKLRREHADPITYNGVEEIAEQLKNELSMANEPGVEVDTQGLIERIESLESAVKEATQTTMSVERKVEELR